MEYIGFFVFGVGYGYLTWRWRWIKYLLIAVMGVLIVIVERQDGWDSPINWLNVLAILLGSLYGGWRAQTDMEKE